MLQWKYEAFTGTKHRTLTLSGKRKTILWPHQWMGHHQQAGLVPPHVLWCSQWWNWRPGRGTWGWGHSFAKSCVLSAKGRLSHCKAASWMALPHWHQWWRHSHTPVDRQALINLIKSTRYSSSDPLSTQSLWVFTFPSYITLLEVCWFEPPTTSPILIQRPSLTLHWYASTFWSSLINRVCPSRFPEWRKKKKNCLDALKKEKQIKTNKKWRFSFLPGSSRCSLPGRSSSLMSPRSPVLGSMVALESSSSKACRSSALAMRSSASVKMRMMPSLRAEV